MTYREPNTMCPTCGLPLRRATADSTVCANAHGFDKDGHPPQKPAKKKAAKKKAK